MWLGLLYTWRHGQLRRTAKERGERQPEVRLAQRKQTLQPHTCSPGETARQEPTYAHPMGYDCGQHGPPWPVLVLLTSALLHVFHHGDKRGAGGAWRRQAHHSWSSCPATVSKMGSLGTCSWTKQGVQGDWLSLTAPGGHAGLRRRVTANAHAREGDEHSFAR